MTTQQRAAENVRNFAHEVLGDENTEWLKTPNPRLDNKTPNELLYTFPGRVENLLIAMQDGDF